MLGSVVEAVAIGVLGEGKRMAREVMSYGFFPMTLLAM